MHSHTLFLAVFFIHNVTVAGGLFWTDRGSSQLKQMQFNGDGLATIPLSGQITSAGSNVRGLALDLAEAKIYWADNGADRILRANFDGTDSTNLFQITGGGSFPADVRFDAVNRELFWCDRDRGTIVRGSLDGGTPITVITNAAATGPYFMDLDLEAGKIYWGDFDGGAIYRANRDGSDRETILTGNNGTRGVCVDPSGGMLYWINRDDKKVHRAPLSAFNSGTIPLTNPLVQTLYTNLDTPHGLVLDLPAGKLYWADTGGNAGLGMGDRSVCRGDLDGSTPLEILASGSEPWDVDLDRRCSSYFEWQQRCFRRDASAEQTDRGADPDGDGILNGVEYAFNLPPLQTGRSSLPRGRVVTVPGGGSFHEVIFLRRTNASDLVYTVEVSTDLMQWWATPGEPEVTEVSRVPAADGFEEVTARTVYPVQGMRQHFMRVSVQLLR